MSKETTNIITVGLLLFALVAWLWPVLLGMYYELEERKKRGEPPEFDERQRLVRMRAGSHTLYVLLGFLALWTAADLFEWFDWTGSLLDMTLCALLLAWCVWASDCIWHDGFTTWKDKRKGADALALTCSSSMLMMLFNFRNTGVCASWTPFVFACGSEAVLAAVLFCKYRKQKKAEAEEPA